MNKHANEAIQELINFSLGLSLLVIFVLFIAELGLVSRLGPLVGAMLPIAEL